MNKNFKKLIMHLMEWVAKHFPDGWRKVATMARYALTLQTPPLQPMMSEFAVPIVEFPREDVEKLIEWLAQYDLISFDVFDTLVLRAFDDPKMIFHLWGLKNCQQYTYNVRSAISLDLRAKTGREIKLTEIYQELERHFGVTAEKGMEQEIQLELRYCMPNPYMKQVYDSLIQMGKRIIIVSDMYLPKEAITRILDKCGYKGYEALYVSCDCGCTKRSGTMWTYLNSLYGDIRRVHVGDSPNGDANQAKRWGWKTKLYTNLHSINGKPWEKEMSHLIGSLYRGTIDRYLYTGSPRKNPLYDLGFVYFGLPIYGFCQWLHELAVGKKIDLILFAARDMYTVHQVYREHYDTPCEYLPISRTSIWRADFDGGVESILERMKLVVNREKPYSIREFCELQHIGFLLPYLKQTLFFITQETLPEIEQAILKHKDEITALLRTDQQGASSYYRNLCEKYNNPKHILFVELNGRGTSWMGLKRIINGAGIKTEIICAMMYTGCIEVEPSNVCGDLHTFIFSSLKNTDFFERYLQSSGKSNPLEKMVFTETNGTLLSYGKDDGYLHYDASLRNVSNIPLIQNGILDFTREFAKYVSIPGGGELHISARDAYWPLFEGANALSFTDISIS